MSDSILTNPAALNALKRHQLVSLSKRYGLKASGKNGDMIERLQAYASTHTSEFGLSEALTTAHESSPPPVGHNDAAVQPIAPLSSAVDRIAHLNLAARLDKKASMMSFASENWEMLSDSGASLISPAKDKEVEDSTVRSWKSAGNGEPLAASDVGPTTAMDEAGTSSSRSSVFAFASSLKRSGTKTFLGPRSASQTSGLAAEATGAVAEEAEAMQRSPCPPSPASTIGIPRRHSKLTLFERPSTLRLCSPTPGLETPRKKGSDLPFVGSAQKLQQYKDRRSMTPLRAGLGTAPDLAGHARRSMPASASTSIYPPIPSFQADSDAPPVPSIPGQYPPTLLHKSSETFTFGSPDHAVSSAQFSSAVQAILRQMNDKLPEEAKMQGEVLRGKEADMKMMVSVTSGLGEGGWGLMERFEGKQDRYADAHSREFAKMRSISNNSLSMPPLKTKVRAAKTSTRLLANPSTPGQKRKHSNGSVNTDVPSAPNGAALASADDRPAKKTRLSFGPNYLGSLREAGRSVMTLLGDGESKTSQMEAEGARRRVTTSTKPTGIRSRFSLFRYNFRKSTTASGKTRTPEERSAALHKSLQRRSVEMSSIDKRAPDLPTNPPMSLSSTRLTKNAQKERMPSTSAQTVTSSASSTVPKRKPLPDFGGVRVASGSSGRTGATTSSISALSGTKPSSSVASGIRKQSQADLIRQARPAPAPPSIPIPAEELTDTLAPLPKMWTNDTPKGGSKRSSTLYASTAASRARMQATVKPPTSAQPGERPLPVPPATAAPSSVRSRGLVMQNPFGAGESRENLFEENFNLAPPSFPPPASSSLRPLPTPGNKPCTSSPVPRSPLKPLSASAASASRIRHKNSGLSAVKSRGNLQEEVDAQRRKAEMRAKAERRNEERELREMLGGARDADMV